MLSSVAEVSEPARKQSGNDPNDQGAHDIGVYMVGLEIVHSIVFVYSSDIISICFFGHCHPSPLWFSFLLFRIVVKAQPVTKDATGLRNGALPAHLLRRLFITGIIVELYQSVLGICGILTPVTLPTAVLVHHDLAVGKLGGRYGARQHVRESDDEEAGDNGGGEEGRGHLGPRVEVRRHGVRVLFVFTSPLVQSLNVRRYVSSV
jgi:hypothetical protein